jgi:hypothetical protein
MASMSFALLVGLLVAAAPTTAKELNSAGMTKYKSRQYVEAIGLFQAALAAGEKEAPLSTREVVDRNKTLALAHFNHACAQSLLRKAGKVCDGDAYRSAITEHLEKSVLLDPNRLDRVIVDKDLEPIRDTLAYHSMLGLSVKREKDLPALLTKVRWWSPGSGAFGSLSQLSFANGGVVTETLREVDPEGGKESKKTVKGRWTLTGRNLSVTLDGKTREGRLGEDGKLDLSGVAYRDEPSECGA